MDRLFSEVQARPYSVRNASVDSLRAIWSGLCSTLVATLRSGKGMSLGQFGTWSFHVDGVDLGTQKKTLRTPVFELSEKFARQYSLRCPRQPSGISGVIPVRDLNVMVIANAAGQPRELVASALKDIFQYVGETGMSGAPIRLDFSGVGTWTCAGGQCRFQFGPAFAGTFESLDRPPTSHGVIPPAPSVYAMMRRPRTGSRPATSNSMLGTRHGIAPPTPPRPASRPPPSPQFRPGIRPATGGQGSSLAATQDVAVAQDMLAPAEANAARLPTPAKGGGDQLSVDDDAQIFVLHDEGLDVSQIEIVVRGRELVVRQQSIGMERVYPLHARVDTEKISAKYKKGKLEIRIPDKASALRAFYAKQMQERGKAKFIEEEEDASLLKQQAKKAEMALALEKQALLARRKARAEVEAYNRKQMGIKKKDPFRMPDECGYLLYNRQEVDSKMTRLSPGMLRSVLDIQVNMKKEVAAREKEVDRKILEAEVATLKQMLEDDERKAVEEKRNNVLRRQVKQAHACLQLCLPRMTATECV